MEITVLSSISSGKCNNIVYHCKNNITAALYSVKTKCVTITSLGMFPGMINMCMEQCSVYVKVALPQHFSTVGLCV